MVASGCGDFQCAFGAFLPFDVAHVFQRRIRGDLARCAGFDQRLAGEMAHGRAQIGCCDHLGCRHPRRFGPRGCGTQQRAVVCGGGHGSGQGTDHRDQGAVKGQLAQCDDPFGGVLGDNVERGKKGQRDGQVEMRAFLRQVSRG